MSRGQPFRVKGYGDFGGGGQRKLRRIVERFGIADTFNGWGTLTVDKTGASIYSKNVIRGAVDLNVAPEKARLGSGLNQDLDYAAAVKDEWYGPVIEMGDRTERANRRADIIDATTFNLGGLTGGHFLPMVVQWRNERARTPDGRPLATEIFITTLSEQLAPRNRLRAYPDFATDLTKAGLIQVVHLVDNLGPVAASKELGRDFMDELLFTGLASQMKTPFYRMETAQRNPAEIYRQLGRQSPVCTSSYGVSYYIPEERGLVGKLFGPRREDEFPIVAAACMRAASLALSNPAWRALDKEEGPRTDLPAYCTLTVPERYEGERDRREFWVPLTRRVTRWFAEQAPWVVVSLCPGPAPSLPALRTAEKDDRRWVQATLTYSVPSRPKPIERILQSTPLEEVLQEEVWAEAAGGSEGQEGAPRPLRRRSQFSNPFEEFDEKGASA